MSDERGAARKHATVGLITAALIATGTLVAAEVGVTDPLLIAIGVIGWMVAAMAAWSWMVKALLTVSRALTQMSQHLETLSEDSRKHHEKINNELKADLCRWVIMWLIEHQGQVQSMERETQAMERALGIADRRSGHPADELAERRAAR